VRSDGRIRIALVVAVLVLGALIVGVPVTVRSVRQARQRRANREELDAALRQGHALGALTELGDCELRTSLSSARTVLAAVSPGRRDWFLARAQEAQLVVQHVRDGLTAGVERFGTTSPAQELALYRSGDRVDLAVGRQVVPLRVPQGWEVWLITPPTPQAGEGWEAMPFRSELKQDGFMRLKFGSNDGWSVEQGLWRIRIRGGGLGKSANAFVLEARADEGVVASASTGWKASGNYVAEVSVRAESPQASYGLEAGNPEGARVAFGWNGADACWELTFRSADETEQTLLREARQVPPGNWARIGLKLTSPFEVIPLLDGVPLDAHALSEPVFGQLRLKAEGGYALFDDFAMRGLEAPLEEGTPMFVKSKAFSEKPLRPDLDRDFVKWAHDTKCYERVMLEVGGQAYSGLRYRIPLYGDFTYEGCPDKGDRLLIRLEADDGEAHDFAFRLRECRWQPVGPDEVTEPVSAAGMEAERPKLRLKCENGTLYQQSPPGGLLARLPGGGGLQISLCTFEEAFDPEDHVIRSTRLWNEFFETAPTDWAWWNGNFGMQYRWACQSYWNWMGGWSRDLAVCFSRASYDGDQTIDYYVSLKDLLAGQEKRHYLRRDLNFSFCTDGRSLASGYSVLFGGFGNSGTYLMRGEEVLASTEKVRLQPYAGTDDDIHYRWWHLTIEKQGGRIRVLVDENEVFDVTDDDPLSGGHLAFWTVGNGFLLARVRVAAQNRQWRPEPFWYEPGEEGEAWKPLAPGCVQLVRFGELTRVVNRIGGGTFAVRWTGGPVELARTPVLELPFQAEDGALVNLHLQVSGQDFLLPVTAPVPQTPAVLCPAWFSMTPANAFLRTLHSPTFPSRRILEPVTPLEGRITVNLLEALGGRAGDSPVLESLIIGNTSNEGYLLAGFGGNGPGAEYRVGVPVCLAQETGAQ